MIRLDATNTDQFYDTISTHYDHIFPFNLTQAKFIQRRLDTASRILDMGCATGSLVIALAQMGHDASGIDLDASLVQLARKKIEAAQSTARVTKNNMMHISALFEANAFHLISCFGNTLSHISPNQLRELFHGVRRILTPDGQFCGQLINYERLFRLNIATLPVIDNTHVRFERTYRLNAPNAPFQFDAVLVDKSNSTTETIEQTLHAIDQSTITNALLDAGFQTVQFFGSFNEISISDDTMPLIFWAQR